MKLGEKISAALKESWQLTKGLKLNTCLLIIIYFLLSYLSIVASRLIHPLPVQFIFIILQWFVLIITITLGIRKALNLEATIYKSIKDCLAVKCELLKLSLIWLILYIVNTIEILYPYKKLIILNPIIIYILLYYIFCFIYALVVPLIIFKKYSVFKAIKIAASKIKGNFIYVISLFTIIPFIILLFALPLIIISYLMLMLMALASLFSAVILTPYLTTDILMYSLLLLLISKPLTAWFTLCGVIFKTNFNFIETEHNDNKIMNNKSSYFSIFLIFSIYSSAELILTKWNDTFYNQSPRQNFIYTKVEPSYLKLCLNMVIKELLQNNNYLLRRAGYEASYNSDIAKMINCNKLSLYLYNMAKEDSQSISYTDAKELLNSTITQNTKYSIIWPCGVEQSHDNLFNLSNLWIPTYIFTRTISYNNTFEEALDITPQVFATRNMPCLFKETLPLNYIKHINLNSKEEFKFIGWVNSSTIPAINSINLPNYEVDEGKIKKVVDDFSQKLKVINMEADKLFLAERSYRNMTNKNSFSVKQPKGGNPIIYTIDKPWYSTDWNAIISIKTGTNINYTLAFDPAPSSQLCKSIKNKVISLGNYVINSDCSLITYNRPQEIISVNSANQIKNEKSDIDVIPTLDQSFDNGIKIINATYGKSCGATVGNNSAVLAKACNGKHECNYIIDFKVIGDPKPGCAKDYIVEWSCNKDKKINTKIVPPEAGYTKILNLFCQ